MASQCFRSDRGHVTQTVKDKALLLIIEPCFFTLAIHLPLPGLPGASGHPTPQASRSAEGRRDNGTCRSLSGAEEIPLGPHWQIVLVWPHERVGIAVIAYFPLIAFVTCVAFCCRARSEALLTDVLNQTAELSPAPQEQDVHEEAHHKLCSGAKHQRRRGGVRPLRPLRQAKHAARPLKAQTWPWRSWLTVAEGNKGFHPLVSALRGLSRSSLSLIQTLNLIFVTLFFCYTVTLFYHFRYMLYLY